MTDSEIKPSHHFQIETGNVPKVVLMAMDRITGDLVRHPIEIPDAIIYEALIAMGWIPPLGDPDDPVAIHEARAGFVNRHIDNRFPDLHDDDPGRLGEIVAFGHDLAKELIAEIISLRKAVKPQVTPDDLALARVVRDAMQTIYGGEINMDLELAAQHIEAGRITTCGNFAFQIENDDLAAQVKSLEAALRDTVKATSEFLSTGSDDRGYAEMIRRMRVAVMKARETLGDNNEGKQHD